MQVPDIDNPKALSLHRRILYWLGRSMASRLFFCLLVLVFYLAVDHVCQNRNRIEDYRRNRGFPLLVLTRESGDNNRADVRQVRYPYRMRRGGNRTVPTYLLPEGKSDPGVFDGDHVSYEVEQVEEGRQRVTLYNWSRSMDRQWRRAVYEATDTSVEPISISGGIYGSHPLASLLVALFFAWAVNRLGRYIAAASTDPSVRSSIRRLREAPWYEDPLCFLILLPFLYYWWETLGLVPYNMADAYAYLWRRPFNWHFFTGRCLSQRVLFRYVCHANLRCIAALQIFAFVASAVLVYALLRRHVGLLVRLLLAAAVVFLFTSYTFNVFAIVASSEPLFIAIALAFPLVVFLWPHPSRHWAVLAFGVFFIFSKNVAPFLAMGLVILAVISDAIHRRHFPTIRMLSAYAVLFVFAVVSMVITQKYDVAVDMNTFNSIAQRILTDEEATEYFIEHFDMPEGDYIEQIRGKSANTRIGGQGLYSVSSETMNFVMLHDQYGFVEWVEEKGRSAFMDYMFKVRPLETMKEVAAGFRRYMTAEIQATLGGGSPFLSSEFRDLKFDPVMYPITDLGPRNYEDFPPDSNAGRLIGENEERVRGFWGFDSLRIMKDALLPLGFASFWLAFSLSLVAIVVGTIFRRAHWLTAGGGMVVFGLAIFFLSFLGDTGTAVRHVFPSLVVVTVGGWLLIIGVMELLARLAAGWYRKRKSTAGESEGEQDAAEDDQIDVTQNYKEHPEEEATL
ncbi:MAG: hypothetical protein ACOCVL_01580 [Candidatus Sumerlaeota bacterium]